MRNTKSTNLGELFQEGIDLRFKNQTKINKQPKKTTARKEGNGALKRKESFKERVVGPRADAEQNQGNEQK